MGAGPSILGEVTLFPEHAGFGVKPALTDIKDVNRLRVPRPEEILSVQRPVEFLAHFARQPGDHLGDMPVASQQSGGQPELCLC